MPRCLICKKDTTRVLASLLNHYRLVNCSMRTAIKKNIYWLKDRLMTKREKSYFEYLHCYLNIMSPLYNTLTDNDNTMHCCYGE